MPLLFSLAIHNDLNEAKQEMLDGEELFAFLDDVYIVSSPERTRHLYNLVGEKLWSMAHGEDTMLESEWEVFSQHGGFGSRGLEPTGSQGVGNANRVGRVPQGSQ